MEIKDIKRIAELMKANDLTEFALVNDDFELAIKRGSDEPQIVYASPTAAPIGVAAPIGAAAAPADVVDENDGLIEIPSPIVGTFLS